MLEEQIRAGFRDPEPHLHRGETIFSIVGVAPADFYGTKVGEYPDVWIPLSMQAQVPPEFKLLAEGQSQFLYVIGRLKPGVTTGQASANVNLLFHQFFEHLTGSAISPEDRNKLARARVDLVSAGKGLSALRRESPFRSASSWPWSDWCC